VLAIVLASVTDPIVDFANNVVGDLGLLGVFVLMLFESADPGSWELKTSLNPDT
jgi:hypothetical protein